MYGSGIWDTFDSFWLRIRVVIHDAVAIGELHVRRCGSTMRYLLGIDDADIMHTRRVVDVIILRIRRSWEGHLIISNIVKNVKSRAFLAIGELHVREMPPPIRFFPIG